MVDDSKVHHITRVWLDIYLVLFSKYELLVLVHNQEHK